MLSWCTLKTNKVKRNVACFALGPHQTTKANSKIASFTFVYFQGGVTGLSL